MKSIVSKVGKLWSIKVLGIVFAVGLLAGPAWAETIRLLSYNVVAQSSPGLPNRYCLDLSPAAGVQNVLSFATPGPARLIIRFNAECAVGGGTSNWLNDDIYIDPAGATGLIIAPPSNSDNALCSGNGTAAHDGWVSAMTQAVVSVPEGGVHRVYVCVNGVGAGATWRIDDLSLTVESEP